MSDAKRLKKLFEDAKNARMDKRDKIFKELDAFDRGDQWNIKSKSYPPWIPRPVTNYVHFVRTYKTASISVESLIGKLRPLSPSDIESVDQLQRIYEYLWDSLNVKHKVRDVISDSRLFGTGVIHVAWDENKLVGGTDYRAEGEIVVNPIPVVNFFPDPTAFTLEDCRYVVIAERKTKNWIKTQAKLNKNVDDVKDSASSSEDRGESLYRDYDSYQTEDKDGIVDFYTFYEKVPNEDGGYGIKVTYMAGGKILHVIPDLKPSVYPFVVLREWKQTHDFWGKSSCEIILDNQKLVNKVESIVATIGTLTSNPIKVVNASSGIDPKVVAKYGSASGYTFSSNTDANKAISYINPPPIPPSLFKLREQTELSIKEIAGLNDAYVGNAIGSVQTSAGINSIIDRATIRDKDAMYELELFVRDLSTLLLKFVTTHYDTARLIRLDNQDPNAESEFEFTEFLGSDYEGLDFDFVIDVTTKTEHSRAKEAQDMQNLLQMQMQFQPEVPLITQQEAIQMSDISGIHKDTILKRMREQEKQVQLEKMKQVIMYSVQAMNTPEAMEQGLTIDQLAEAGLQIMQPTSAKLGSVNMDATQQRQAGI